MLEQRNYRGAKVVEIHEPVKVWHFAIQLLREYIVGYLTSEADGTQVSILVEDEVDEEEFCQDGLREVFYSLADELGISDYVEVAEQASIAENEYDI